MISRLALGAVLLAGCYSPDLRDCTVTCTMSTDCAGGQTCGSDGLCVGEATAACGSAAESPDAAVTPSTIELHVTVDGKGSVYVDSQSNLCAADGNHGDCMFTIAAQTAHKLYAIPQPGRAFMMWTGACSGSATTCSLTPTADAMVGAMFQN